MPSGPVALSSQVGGHAGVLTTEDGSLVIKVRLPAHLSFLRRAHLIFLPPFPLSLADFPPVSLVSQPALPQEVDFYQSVATLDELSALQPFIPAFLGTLKLQGEIEPGKQFEGKDLEGVAKGEDVEGVKKVVEEKEVSPYF